MATTPGIPELLVAIQQLVASTASQSAASAAQSAALMARLDSALPAVGAPALMGGNPNPSPAAVASAAPTETARSRTVRLRSELVAVPLDKTGPFYPLAVNAVKTEGEKGNHRFKDNLPWTAEPDIVDLRARPDKKAALDELYFVRTTAVYSRSFASFAALVHDAAVAFMVDLPEPLRDNFQEIHNSIEALSNSLSFAAQFDEKRAALKVAVASGHDNADVIETIARLHARSTGNDELDAELTSLRSMIAAQLAKEQAKTAASAAAGANVAWPQRGADWRAAAAREADGAERRIAEKNAGRGRGRGSG